MCMRNMFSGSKSFDQDLSKSNVTPVVDMGDIFSIATSSKKILWGETWVNSKVDKNPSGLRTRSHAYHRYGS